MIKKNGLQYSRVNTVQYITHTFCYSIIVLQGTVHVLTHALPNNLYSFTGNMADTFPVQTSLQ